jgi:hypothetical protein
MKTLKYVFGSWLFHLFMSQEAKLPCFDIYFCPCPLPLVQLISAESLEVLAYASELFTQEITMLAWGYTEELKRKILQRVDIQHATSHFPEYDFLIDTVPRPTGPEERVLNAKAVRWCYFWKAKRKLTFRLFWVVVLRKAAARRQAAWNCQLARPR